VSRGREEPTSRRDERRLYRRIFEETRGFRPRILVLAGVGLLSTPLALLMPMPVKIVVDSVLDDRPLPGPIDWALPAAITDAPGVLLVFAAALQVAVVAALYVQAAANLVLMTSVGEHITLRLQSRMLDHVQQLSFAFHDERGTADSLYRIRYDAQNVQALPVGLVPLGAAIVTFFAMVVVIVQIDVPLALIALAISPPLYLATELQRRRMLPKYTEEKELESSVHTIVQEVLTAFRVVKAFGRERHETERFAAQSRRGVLARVRLRLEEGAFDLVVAVTTAVGTALVLYVGVQGVQQGRLSLGELLLVIGYLTLLYGPLQEVSGTLARLQEDVASSQRVYELLDERPQVTDRPNAHPIERARGRFTLDGVSFGYDPDRPVLRDVTFAIPAGSRVGISGRTGAGKTTLVSLLTRFYDPTEGRIRLDSYDLRYYRLADLRAQFAIVLQDPVLFATSVAENVRYARPDASDDEVLAAIAAAGAEEFVSGLPHGVDTLVGERGMRLSGGERQRISIARAFLKDAPILILDEPTSSVDTETERAIMGTMRELMEGRTTFMIAHRLSTLEICDLRLHLEDGKAELMDIEYSA
jgi:ATP-binding cassette, subfamily B, bacterial